MIEEEDANPFNFCDKVDIHALDYSTDLNAVVAIAAEHGFRGIVVPMGRLEALVKQINRAGYGDKSIIPICAVDYPFGESSLDARSYFVNSAKEKGAGEIEIVAPYHLIVNRDFRKIYEDAQSLVTITKKYDIHFKYVVDQNSHFIDEAVRGKLCSILSSTHIPTVSMSLGFFDKTINHSDNVVKMRAFKVKAACNIKAYISTSDPNEFALYPKAGVDIIGLDWKKAPYLVHAYEGMVQKKS